MKNIAITFFLLLITTICYSQKAFKTTLENKASSTVELSVNASEIIITGAEGNDVIIEAEGIDKVGTPRPKVEQSPERAKGLKPISSSNQDNTGQGVSVEKKDDYIHIRTLIPYKADKISITLPNNVKLIFSDQVVSVNKNANYRISNFTSEITVTSLNSNFVVEKITGPLVLNTTNGNAEIIYDALKTTKPISVVTVNGFVDLTMPSATKANLNFHTVNGQIYSDFEIEKKESSDMSVSNVNMFHLDGRISGGGVPVNINTVNGDIYFRKK